ncbi:ABC transporter ATP-binding protein [Streptosporangium pseudovulgare]|uniref:ABC transporter ATP-binding protein n=1 Tax=Streptosporangium pseudovulgare TaxID=35765 RepID=A0ABQ2R0I3_9ACTN|nr:ABC transporter ATP-binding protein [Streptosporangium pseudovulgare]GGQ07259.1 ABC transporter ATP-binding protein [Streptosporangium pseudovulgare]
MERTHRHAVAAHGLRKHYGDVRAVDGIDLLIEPGEVVALLGPNGAGKSTMIDMLLGLTRPDAGEVRLMGETPAEAVRGGAVGVMLQEAALLDDVTVREIVVMIASLHRAPLPVEEALRRAGVTDLAGRRPARLSGGQKQRVRFAMALVSDPGLLVLDEPTSAMDVGVRREFWAAVRSLTGAGRTVLFATHHLEEAEKHADRVVLVRDGRVVADGPVAAVISEVGGWTVRAAVPGALPEELRALPGVTAVELRGDRAELRCADSAAPLRELLARFPAAHDVEVRALSLEEAFLRLTAPLPEEV